jgi:acetolactate synthase-1/2/3 large subunit
MVKVSDFIAQHLSAYGIKHVFMITGGGAMHLNDSFGQCKAFEIICTHHEQGAAIAAEGYYRASGNLAAVNVTTGPGGTNTLTGVIGQWLDSIPCIYISGQVKRESTIAFWPQLKLRQLGDQEINIVDIVRPVTKYAVMVRDPLKVRYHLDKALYLATHGRRGPVWLDIPLDVQATQVDESGLSTYDPREDEIRFDPEKIRNQVGELLERLKASARPVLLAGHGIRLAGAADLFLRVVDSLNIPIVTSISGNDLIWSDHPLYFGRPGIAGDRIGNFVIQNSDLMLALGARMGIRLISYNYGAFAREAFRAMVDIDPAELRKPTLRLHMPVHADARLFIEEMLRRLRGNRLPRKEDWLQWCRKQKQTLPGILEDNPRNPDYVNSYVFTDTLFQILEPGSIVVTGNGAAFTGTFQAMRIKRGMRVFANECCASMGYCLPAAIGACFSSGKRPIVLITGDGSIQMNIQELQTISFHKLPIKIFVLNNRGYHAIRMTQSTYFEGRHIGSGPEYGVGVANIGKIAEAFGLPSTRIDNESVLPGRIQEILSRPGPVVCEVPMDPNQTLNPKLSSVVTPDGKMVSKPLEDLYPFLDREKFHAAMIVKSLE